MRLRQRDVGLRSNDATSRRLGRPSRKNRRRPLNWTQKRALQSRKPSASEPWSNNWSPASRSLRRKQRPPMPPAAPLRQLPRRCRTMSIGRGARSMTCVRFANVRRPPSRHLREPQNWKRSARNWTPDACGHEQPSGRWRKDIRGSWPPGSPKVWRAQSSSMVTA